MFAETAVHTSVSRDAVFAKTAKGRGEVTARGMGLSGRQRTVLIMLDGQRSCAALAAVMPEGQVAGIVTELLALDLIAPCAGAEGASMPAAPGSTAAVPAAGEAVPAPVAAAVPAADEVVLAPVAASAFVAREAAPPTMPDAAVSATASATASVDAPDAGPPQADASVAAIKAYMVQAAQTYLGLLAAEVVERIERAHDAAGLRGVVGHWHMALQASKHGRERAAAHIEYVRTGLREAGIEA